MLRQSRLLSYVSPAIIVHSAIAANFLCHPELAAKSVERESKRDFMPLPCDSETMNEQKTCHAEFISSSQQDSESSSE